MSYRIIGLDPKQFAPLFALTDEQLAARGMARLVADEKPGFPCRVTLRDADIGETLLLLNYEHHGVQTPYRSSHAIFVTEHATRRYDEVNRIPEVMTNRLLSIRSFDGAGMMLDADIAAGTDVEPLILRLFADPRAAYLHVHNAKRGCFSARVERA